jgi:hypothetical protein
MLTSCRRSLPTRTGARTPVNWIPATLTLCSAQVLSLRAENQAGYRYENYQEGNGRIGVETQTGLFELKPLSWMSFQAELGYDVVSGASPTGAPPPATIQFVPDENGNPPPGASSTSVPLAPMHEQRWYGGIGATFSYKQSRLTPSYAYSTEHDYTAHGVALNYALDLNEKNTTLNVGWSYNWDEVLPGGFLRKVTPKYSNDLLVGVNQLLGPTTVLTANLGYGYAHGYLNDQYKGVLFDNEPQGDPSAPALEPESRPGHRDKYIAYVSVTQGIPSLNASVEGTYRFFYDSYYIQANMAEVAWYQNFGKHFQVAPFFRYYRQGNANFYVTRLPDYDTRPNYYSADYRLSELDTFTLGINLSYRIKEWVSIDFGYRRYVMNGLDGVTSSTAYPSANVFSVGARIWF